LVIGYWLLVIGYWLLVIGYWLLVIGYWLVGGRVVGCRLSVVGCLWIAMKRCAPAASLPFAGSLGRAERLQQAHRTTDNGQLSLCGL